MKRDYEILREILTDCENTLPGIPYSEIYHTSRKNYGECKGPHSHGPMAEHFDEACPKDCNWLTLAEHVVLLIDYGHLEETEQHYAMAHVSGYRLTAQGHDFLDSIRDDGVWARVKRAVSQSGRNLQNVPLQVIVNVATRYMSSEIQAG